LQRLAGREHRVLTGLALLVLGDGPERWAAGYEETIVRFAPISPTEITRYVQSGEPLDKAGAYGIQGAAALFVEGIAGCYSNVVGLPLRRLYVLAGEAGVRVAGWKGA
nr:Maf family protein [Armatimonadota bacterium]